MNRKTEQARDPAFQAPAPTTEWLPFLSLDEGAFDRRFAGRAVRRAKRSGFVRNVAYALGNRGDRSAIPALERAVEDGDPVVADAAAWALDQLRDAVA